MISPKVCSECDTELLEDPSGHLSCPSCNLENFIPINYSFKKKEASEDKTGQTFPILQQEEKTIKQS